MSSQPDTLPTTIIAAYFAFFAIFFIIIFAFTIIIQWKIATKAGFSGPLSLLMLIPMVNLIMLCIFAFGEWPIERALKIARGEAGGPQMPTWTPPSTPYLPPPNLPPSV